MIDEELMVVTVSRWLARLRSMMVVRGTDGIFYPPNIMLELPVAFAHPEGGRIITNARAGIADENASALRLHQRMPALFPHQVNTENRSGKRRAACWL